MTKPFPLLSLLALVSAALFYVVSAYHWHDVVWHRIESTEFNSEDAQEDTGRFASMEVVLRAWGTGAVGALVGVGLAIVAHLRKEAYPAIRYLATTGNVFFLAYSLFLSPAIFASFSSSLQ